MPTTMPIATNTPNVRIVGRANEAFGKVRKGIAATVHVHGSDAP